MERVTESASNGATIAGRAVRCVLICLLSGAAGGCVGDAQGVSLAPYQVESDAGGRLDVTPVMAFDHPWAMVFLPDGQLLVTEKGGTLWLVNLPWDTLTDDGGATPVEMSAEDRTVVSGLPEIRSAGQGGLGDVILHPEFSENGLVYISYVEREGDLSGAAVARGTLDRSDKSNVKLVGLTVIWRQSPKVTGQGHYGHRLAFSADGHLFITSGERQKFDPAQSKLQNLGKIIRLNDDGSLPGDNPFAAAGGVTAEFWSLGHRNPLGIAFDRKTRLWVHEMGPRGGDELNLIKPARNYGYPLVSDGDHYSGLRIPDHDTRPDLEAPAISWNPVISPSGLVIYDGDRFPEWRDTGLIGGLSSQSLVRVALEVPAKEIERYGMGARIREVEQGPDGRVFLLEDGADGRLLHLSQR